MEQGLKQVKKTTLDKEVILNSDFQLEDIVCNFLSQEKMGRLQKSWKRIKKQHKIMTQQKDRYVTRRFKNGR